MAVHDGRLDLVIDVRVRVDVVRTVVQRSGDVQRRGRRRDIQCAGDGDSLEHVHGHAEPLS
jgi:hypothetical protein